MSSKYTVIIYNSYRSCAISCIQVSRQLFTGPYARQMLDPKRRGESQRETEKWKVFVLLEQKKQGLVLNKDSEVLYQVYIKLINLKPCILISVYYYILWQDSNYQTGKYTILDVNDDCVRLSKFIETKLTGCQYEDGKAFYEVMENEAATKQEESDAIEIEENLFYCKKILRPIKNEVYIYYYIY